MKHTWHARLASYGGYRRTTGRGSHLNITAKVYKPATQEDRRIEILLTPREAEQVIASLQYALQAFRHATEGTEHKLDQLRVQEDIQADRNYGVEE